MLGKDFSGITTQKFGIEVECTGLTRAEASEALAGVFATEPRHFGGAYDKYGEWDSKGRLWTIVSDSSIECTYRDGEPADSFFAVELVSPILDYEDISLLQEVIRALRHAGGVTGSQYCCGTHIHISADDFTPQQVRNLANIFASKEDYLWDALQISSARSSYCKRSDSEFINAINKKKPKTMDSLKRLWYKGDDEMSSTRYHALNLHSFFQNGHYEIRCCNGSLHAGEVRSQIVLALAINNVAMTKKYCSARLSYSDNMRYSFRVWLMNLGLIGDEFKNCRMHLLKHLEGNIAWRHPEDAIAQRERLKQKRLAEKERRVSPVSNEREIFGKVPIDTNKAAVSDCESDLDEVSEAEESIAVMTM